MALIAAQFYLGSECNSLALTAGSVTYAASSMLGYFNMGSSPIVRFCRLNLISGFLAIVGVGQLATGNWSLALMMLLVTHVFDAVQAATQDRRQIGLGESQTRQGPIEEFLLTSWRNNGFAN